MGNPTGVKGLTKEPMATSVVNFRLLFIEFSPETITGLVMYDKIEVGKSWYTLKGLVRCQQSHFTCAIHS